MKKIRYNGEEFTIPNLAKKLGISVDIVRYRVKKTIPLDKPFKKKEVGEVKFALKTIEEMDLNTMFGTDLFTGVSPLPLLEQAKLEWNDVKDSSPDFIVIHPLKQESQPAYLYVGYRDNIRELDIYVSHLVPEGRIIWGTSKSKKKSELITALG